MTKNKAIVLSVIVLATFVFSSFDNPKQPAEDHNDLNGNSEAIAPGYLGDEVCASCHAEIVDDYALTRKKQSFFRPSADRLIERFDTTAFFNKASQRFYQMSWTGGKMLFYRYQIFNNRFRINEVRLEVDYVLGAGDQMRNYLYQTENGELFQLPISWYTEKDRWDMAPGFLRGEHDGVERQITKECLFCHADYPNIKEESPHWGQEYFPKNLPHGIGCQRCHGSGAEHVRIALDENSDEAEIRSSILNLADLPHQERDDVCNQCHLQPTTAVTGIRRPGMHIYSFEPGDLLTDYMVHVDLANVQRNGQRTFELNHQAYRLYQSACYLESAGKLTCTSCHDPHRAIEEDRKVDHYSVACKECHEEHAIAGLPNPLGAVQKDCQSCHMPKRRPVDATFLLKTDHLISIVREPESGLKEIEEEDIIIRTIQSYNLPKSDEYDRLYVALALLKERPLERVVDYVKGMVGNLDSIDIHPYYYLAEAEIAMNRPDSAVRFVELILNERPDDPMALEWKGLALLKAEHYEQAENLLSRSFALNPNRAEISYNLGLFYYAKGELDQAKWYFENSLSLRENMKISWYYLARVYLDLEEYDAAADCAKRAIAIDPIHTRSYLILKDALLALDKKDEAIVYLQHAYEIVPNELVVWRELQKLE